MTENMNDHRVYAYTQSAAGASDLTIKCGTFTFNVHESVLRPQSEFFAKLLQVDMLEKTSRMLNLTEQNPYAVQALLYYAYNKQYDHGTGNDEDRESPLVCDAQVYALADEYGMEDLKTYAQEKFEKLAREQYLDDGFALAIRVAYTKTPTQVRGLRDAAAKLATEKFEDLRGSTVFSQTMDEVAAFGADVARHMAYKRRTGPHVICCCPACRHHVMTDIVLQNEQHCPRCRTGRFGWASFKVKT